MQTDTARGNEVRCDDHSQPFFASFSRFVPRGEEEVVVVKGVEGGAYFTGETTAFLREVVWKKNKRGGGSGMHAALHTKRDISAYQERERPPSFLLLCLAYISAMVHEVC